MMFHVKRKGDNMDWIFVEDELPTKRVEVVCMLRDESICLGAYDADKEDFLLDIVIPDENPWNYDVIAYCIIPDFIPKPTEEELEEQQRQQAEDYYWDLKIDEARGR